MGFQDDPMGKIICVMGFPSGGTTMITGMLQRLGVDIGPVADESPYANRDYANLEDLTITKHMWDQAISANERNSRIKHYMNDRIALQNKTGVRVAFKFPTIYRCIQGEGWQDWPIMVVSVERDLLTMFRSNIEKSKEIGANRAKQVGLMVYQRDEWLKHYRVALTIFYEKVLGTPSTDAVMIASHLHLHTTDEQIHAAAQFVDPAMRRF